MRSPVMTPTGKSDLVPGATVPIAPAFKLRWIRGLRGQTEELARAARHHGSRQLCRVFPDGATNPSDRGNGCDSQPAHLVAENAGGSLEQTGRWGRISPGGL